MTNLNALERALNRKQKSSIPESFAVSRYGSSLNQSAAWWSIQLGNRIYLKNLARIGDTAQFEAYALRLWADPFTDLGFRYINASHAQITSPKVTTVTSLTFGKSSLIGRLANRCDASELDSCDDKLGLASSLPESEDLLSFSSVAHVQVDLAATDSKILSDFRRFLKQHRRKHYALPEVRSKLSQATFDRWVQCRVLPCFDIQFWASLTGNRIGPTELGEWLGVGAGRDGCNLTGINGKDFYIKKVKPALKQAFNPSTYQVLYTLGQHE